MNRRCELYIHGNPLDVCGAPATYTISSATINFMACADCARGAERALMLGLFEYRGRPPERGEVVISAIDPTDDPPWIRLAL